MPFEAEPQAHSRKKQENIQESAMRLISLLVLITTLGCSTAVKPKAVEAVPAEPTEHGIELELMEPGMVLELGMKWLYNNHPDWALDAFETILDDRRLNLAGHALAYWYMFFCYAELDDLETAPMMLVGFINAAERIMAMRDTEKFLVGKDGKDFVDSFNLEARLKQAKESLEMAWTDRK